MTTPDPAAQAIVFNPKAPKPPPITTVGVLGWLRGNLFYSKFSTLLTLAGIYIIYSLLAFLYDWGIANAVWEAGSRRECLDAIAPDGEKVGESRCLLGRHLRVVQGIHLRSLSH